MLAFQIEPASLCLGALLVGLPMLIWLALHHRHARDGIQALQSDLQAAQASAAERVQALEAARVQHQQALDALRDDHTRRSDARQAEHQRQLDELKQAHELAIDEARKELSIVTFPYESEQGDKGWVVDDRLAEVGYQYQMFIRGVPCFEPHKVVVHRLQKKEVNQEKVANLSQQVLGLLENVASKHPALTVARKFVPLAR